MSRRTALVVTLVAVLAASTSVLAQPTVSVNDVNQAEGSAGTSLFTFTATLSSPVSTETLVRFASSNGTASVGASTVSTTLSMVVPGTGTAGTAAPYPGILTMAGFPTITGMAVRLSGVSHTFPDDFDVLLVGPGGQKVLLMSDVGGSTDLVGVNLEFRDGAPPIPDGGPLVSGTYQPTNAGTGDAFPAPAPLCPCGTSLSVFNGTNPNGTWTLYVFDDVGGDVGAITGMELLLENSSGDYATAFGEVVFPPGTTSRPVPVTVFGDTTVEPHQTFLVTLTSPIGAALGDAVGQGRIVNDDGGGPPPLTLPDGFSTPVSTPLAAPAPGVLANDTSGGGPLSAFLVTGVAHGLLSLPADGSFLYTPSAGYAGPDSFTYRALNSFAQSGVTTVNLVVGSSPTGLADAYATAFAVPLTVPAPGVLANDSSHGVGVLSASLVSGVAHGTLSLNGEGSFVYTPALGYEGADTFSYRPVSSFGPGAPVLVALTVGPPPVTTGDAFSVAFEAPLSVAAPGVLVNDNGNGGGSLTAVLLSTTSQGSLSLAADGGFTYTPNPGFAGSDSFTYRAQAAGPGNAATVTLTVNEPTTVQPPTDLYVSAMVGNTVTFRFTPQPLGPDATGFVLEGGLNPGEVLASLPTGTAAPIFTIVAPTGSFYVRVHATAGGEKSAASNEIQIHVNLPVPPSAPDLLTAAVDGSTLVLGWRNTFGGGAASALVLDVTGSVAGQIPLGPAEGFSASGVPSGTYTLSLLAVNGGGASAPSGSITVTVPGPCSGAPQAPAHFLAYTIGSTVYVVWEPPASGPAASHYVLSVSGSFVGSFQVPARAISGQVGPGSYTLSISAVNPCGTGPAAPAQTVVVP